MHLPPLLDRISDYVDYWAKETPDNAVFFSPDGSVSYSELARRVDSLARALLAIGIGKGDTVAMLATPQPFFLETLLATASIGAIWVGLNPRLTATELAGILSDAKPGVILSQHSFEGTGFITLMLEAMALAGHSPLLVTFDGVDPRALNVSDFIDEGRAVSESRLRAMRDNVGASDAAVLVYTSGSTGAPKGVMLSHHSLCFVYREQIVGFGVVGGHFVAALPINHIGGIGFVGCNPLIGGGSMSFADRFDPAQVLDQVAHGYVDCILALSGMIQAMVDHPLFDRTSFKHVRTIAWGGAALSRTTVMRLQSKGCRLATLYGMSEMPGSISVTAPDATTEELTETVGRVSPYVALRIVDGDGRESAPGEPGEIRVKHSSMFLGYFGMAEETKATLDDAGYFRTGDIGSVDEWQNLRIVGRIKEMYKSGGYNIYPGEIEACIRRHPEVAAAAVVALPDRTYNEVGWAFVLARTADAGDELAGDVAAWCARHLANYKRPKRVLVLNDFPKLPSGKTDKNKLREYASRWPA